MADKELGYDSDDEFGIDEFREFAEPVEDSNNSEELPSDVKLNPTVVAEANDLVMPAGVKVEASDFTDVLQEESRRNVDSDELLQLLGDQILASVLQGDELSLKNRSYVFGQFTPIIFRNENFVLYYILYNFKDKGITPDTVFIVRYLSRQTKIFSDNRMYINLQRVDDIEEVTEYISKVVKQYQRLCDMEIQEESDFRRTIESYKLVYSQYEMGKAYTDAKEVLYTGRTVGKKHLQGYEDSISYVKRVEANIDSMLDQTSGDGFIDSRREGIDDESLSTKEKPILIGDFGDIKELNANLKGLYTSMFYNIMAPTKGGKSKFTARLMHNIAVVHGFPVSVWPHEGGYKAWWAQMRAIHFDYLQEKKGGNRVAPLSQQQILYDDYPSPEIRALEMDSRNDLFTNPAYGVMMMIDRPFKVETFIDEIETSVQLNHSKAILIDYLQLIGWDNRNMSKPQAVGQAYQMLLSYCKKRNILAVSPSQFTQSFMNEMAHSAEGDTHELRTAGGESAEIIRTPDINIALYATTEDLMNHRMKILSVPSRLASSFPAIEIQANLCSCVFKSI